MKSSIQLGCACVDRTLDVVIKGDLLSDESEPKTPRLEARALYEIFINIRPKVNT